MNRSTLNIVTWIVLLVTIGLVVGSYVIFNSRPISYTILGLGVYLSFSPRLVKEWERGILLRLGKFSRVVPPGLCWVVPGFDTMTSLVDMRVRATSFSAEKALTRDTVPVNVDAVLFWLVTDAKKAILEVEGYRPTVSWAAQTTLRDVIGKSDLARMISDRESLDLELQNIIDAKTSEWGVTVQSVEIRDVKIPGGLEDAMSRKAQADRERDARIVLAESEVKVAEQMDMASEIYASNQTAMQLRAMNMTYESVKEKGALMVIPSNMVESVNAGMVFGAATGGAFKTKDS